VDALDAIAKETGKSVRKSPSTGFLRDQPSPALFSGARNEEQLRQKSSRHRLETNARPSSQTRRRQRLHPDLPLLAPTRFPRAHPGPRPWPARALKEGSSGHFQVARKTLVQGVLG